MRSTRSCTILQPRTRGLRRRRHSPSDSRPASASHLKREDLLHTGAHKLNNAVRSGRPCEAARQRRIVAETGAGRHGDRDCDGLRALQLRVRRLRARKTSDGRSPTSNVRAARRRSAQRRLRDEDAEGATSEAIRDTGSQNVETTHYFDQVVHSAPRRTGARRRAAIRDRPGGARTAAPPSKTGFRKLSSPASGGGSNAYLKSSTASTGRGRSSHRGRGGGAAPSAPGARRAARRTFRLSVGRRGRGRSQTPIRSLGRPRLSRRQLAHYLRPGPPEYRRRDGAARHPGIRRPRTHRGDHSGARAVALRSRAPQLDAELILICLKAGSDKDHLAEFS